MVCSIGKSSEVISRNPTKVNVWKGGEPYLYLQDNNPKGKKWGMFGLIALWKKKVRQRCLVQRRGPILKKVWPEKKGW